MRKEIPLGHSICFDSMSFNLLPFRMRYYYYYETTRAHTSYEQKAKICTSSAQKQPSKHTTMYRFGAFLIPHSRSYSICSILFVYVSALHTFPAKSSPIRNMLCSYSRFAGSLSPFHSVPRAPMCAVVFPCDISSDLSENPRFTTTQPLCVLSLYTSEHDNIFHLSRSRSTAAPCARTLSLATHEPMMHGAVV